MNDNNDNPTTSERDDDADRTDSAELGATGGLPTSAQEQLESLLADFPLQSPSSELDSRIFTELDALNTLAGQLSPAEQSQLETLLADMAMQSPSRELDSRVFEAINTLKSFGPSLSKSEQSQLEILLAAMALQSPSSQLDGRVHNTIANAAQNADHNTDPYDFAAASQQQQVASPTRLPWAMFALAAAACVALVFMILFNPANNTNTNDPNNFAKDNTPGTPGYPGHPNNADQTAIALANFNPVRIEQGYTNIQPEGIIFIDDNTPMRRFQRQRVEHVELIDEKQNIRIEITLPQNDVIVTPVDYD